MIISLEEYRTSFNLSELRSLWVDGPLLVIDLKQNGTDVRCESLAHAWALYDSIMARIHAVSIPYPIFPRIDQVGDIDTVLLFDKAVSAVPDLLEGCCGVEHVSAACCASECYR